MERVVEEVTPGFSVCGACGAMLGGDAGPFDRTSFRYRSRLYGLPLLWFQKLSTPIVRDGADRPIARVERPFSLRRAGAIVIGAMVFVAALLAYLWMVGDLLPDGWLGAQLIVLPGVLAIVALTLAIVALLSPGPEARLVSLGRMPHTLVRFRSVRDGWTESELEVEDGGGARIGSVVVHRLRNVLWPLSWLGPIATLSAGATRVDVTRPSPLKSGLHFLEGNDVVATFACNQGVLARDALEISDPPPLDPRLFVTAMIVTRP
jgi:hypothetical protein